MKADAEKFAKEDELKKEKVEKRNAAEGLIFQTEKQIGEFGDKLDDNDKSRLNNTIKELQEVLKEGDMEGIDELTEKLNSVWQEISTKLYQQTQEETPETPETNNETQDVKYEEVKE